MQSGENINTSGNTILITGGATGIGYALAEAFVNAGNDVIINATNAIIKHGISAGITLEIGPRPDYLGLGPRPPTPLTPLT